MRFPLRLTAVVVALYALGYPLGALALDTLSPALLLTARFALSAIILGTWAVAVGVTWPRGATLGHAIVAGALTQGLQFGGAYFGMAHGVSAGMTALIIGLNPAFTVLGARIWLGERFSRRGLVSVGMAVVAVGFACGPRIGSLGGLLVASFAGLFGICVGGLYQQRYLGGVAVTAVNTIGVTTGLLMVGTWALLTPQHVYDLPKAVIVVPIMVIVSSVIATTAYLALINRVGAGAISVLFGVIPSLSVLLSWLLLGEVPHWGVYPGLLFGAIACWVRVGGRHTGDRQTGDEGPGYPARGTVGGPTSAARSELRAT